MGRPVVLSNGQIFVGLDENGLVHDFYYPYVGLENLTNARSLQHKIGVWVDGAFRWTDDGSWVVNVEYITESLISNITLKSSDLQIDLKLNDYIDNDCNALVRHIEITNNADSDRDVRLFMHQVFEISRSGRADTALYVPDGHYLLDYKGRYSLLIGGQFSDGQDFDQYAVGNYAIEGKAGTFRDAEDGELSMNAVEHGGVDSVIRFERNIESAEMASLDYWIIAGSSQTEVQRIHEDYKSNDMNERLKSTQNYWQNWLETPKSTEMASSQYSDALSRSKLFIKAHCDERGSVLASGDSSIFNYGRDYYCYCWPRDAAYAIWPLIRLGHFEEARRFFDFAQGTLHKDGYLMHKYQPDRAVGSTWHPLIHGNRRELAIQEDETAGVLFMLHQYYEYSKDEALIHSLYNTFIVPCANFMTNYVDQETGLPHASYDLWEEKFLTTTYTVSIVIASLFAAAKMAKLVDMPEDVLRWQNAAKGIQNNIDKLYNSDGYFVKGFLLEDGKLNYDNTLDISSLYGPYMYAGIPLDDHRLTSTAKHVAERITDATPLGGVLRYENDNYFLTKQFKGNPWIVSTLWLAQYYVSVKNFDEANRLLKWTMDRQLTSGALSEQYDPENGTPLSVSPLVWSHAELINTILDLSE